MNVSLVVNPIAGNRAYRSINKIEAILRKKAALNTCITRKKGDAFEFAKQLGNTGRIIIASGDGTINEVINGILSSSNKDLADIPVALIPLGTTNVLAKELGIPESIEKAVDLALNRPARKISLGRINGHYFSLMAGIGFDGETVSGVKDGLIKKISGKGAHIVSGLKVLAGYNPPLITVKTSDDILTGYTVIVGNARNYGGYFHVTPNASITEPVLDLCVFSGSTRKDFLRLVFGVMQKKHLDFPDVAYGKFSEMEITSSGTVHVQIDGDYFGTLPVRIDVVKDAVSLVW